MVQISIPTKENDTRPLIHKYLEILNIVNPDSSKKLTDKEILVLAEFLLLPEKYSYQRFSRYAKPQVLSLLKTLYDWDLSVINLNTKIYELVSKGYIWRDTDGVLYLKEYLIKSIELLRKNPEIRIKLVDDNS